MHARDDRLEELFVRYWDNTLTPEEVHELSARLTADSAERERFQILCLQAVSLADQALAKPETSSGSSIAGRFTRRRLLTLVGAGVALGGAAWFLNSTQETPSPGDLELEVLQGIVRLTLDRRVQRIKPGRIPLPAGAVVIVEPPDGWAILHYPDGSMITLTGGSMTEVEVSDPSRIVLRGGHLSATLKPQSGLAHPISLATTIAAVTAARGASLALGYAGKATEVLVQSGQADVADMTGKNVDALRGGELLTLNPGGARKREAAPATPETYAWNLAEPLPEDWGVGTLHAMPDEQYVTPEFWYDPYHSAVMSQIRSHNRWTRGFFRLHADSRVRVKYRVERPGQSQICICVRTDTPDNPKSGVLGMTRIFENARPGRWEELDLRAGDMMDDPNAPAFGPPWVGFLVIFNTYLMELGLHIAEFRVDPP